MPYDKRDEVTPGKSWEFNEEVTACFANMLERSIPDYRVMRSLVYKIGERFIAPGTTVVDIGCSTGLAVEPFVKKYGDRCRFILIDNAPAMVAACKERFAEEAKAGTVRVVEGDYWNVPHAGPTASLVLAILSIQFMPTAYRQQMLEDIYHNLVPGGAFIFVEKVAATPCDDTLVDLYYEMKRENGYTEAQIQEKRRSLENVLSPLSPAWNEELLRYAGFKKVDMFWRCLNFCGWIAVK